MSKGSKKDVENGEEGEPYFFPEHQITIYATSQEQALKKLAAMQDKK